ncbi:TetR/AcrR family transcriptional regulator [Agromyces tardus]|jgi:AcrR family transcriptional regulator|uniref:TetR/AcrR family transcriptional regulator n=1 Tax=Agromyces tardus TaxID=2583849 RepID=A0A3M8A440_9MICO|nr:TetR/AcrR family transcriptional regulator [Agromyces tardus]RNB45964.1 TetR/AcrR family transcriptional regulator [Agromyces tardus]
MPKVTEAYRDARRDEIAAAALRCFAAKGFHRTSMADIIAESGLSAGAIYGHFESKEALLSTVAARILSARGNELDALSGDHPLAPGEVVAALIAGIRSEPFDATGLLLQVWAEAAINPELREVLQGVLMRARATIRPHVLAWAELHPEHSGDDPHGYADRVIPVLMGLLPGFIVQRAVIDDFDADAYVATIPALLPR